MIPVNSIHCSRDICKRQRERKTQVRFNLKTRTRKKSWNWVHCIMNKIKQLTKWFSCLVYKSVHYCDFESNNYDLRNKRRLISRKKLLNAQMVSGSRIVLIRYFIQCFWWTLKNIQSDEVKREWSRIFEQMTKNKER